MGTKLGDAMFERRAFLRQSQADAAKDCGVSSDATFSMWERGLMVPQRVEIPVIAAWMERPVAEIMAMRDEAVMARNARNKTKQRKRLRLKT